MSSLETRGRGAWLRVGDSQPARLVGLRLTERLSAPWEGSAELDEEVAAGLEVAPHGPVQVVIDGADGDGERTFTLVARRVRRTARGLSIELGSPALDLELGSRPRRFRDRTARQIAEAVLASAGIEVVWQAREGLLPIPYVVQHDESDFALIVRLLAHEGIYFSFDEAGRAIIGDTSIASELVSRDAIPWITGEAGLVQGVGVFEIFRGRRVAPGSVTVADYDWKRPLLTLQEGRTADRDGDLEQYVWPGGFRDPDVGARLAALRLEAARAGAEYAEGKSSVAAFAAGKSFALGASAGAVHAGEYFIYEVEHVVSGRGGPRGGYENRFRACPRALPYRVPVTRAPAIAGLESALARGPTGVDIHTDQFGRFKAEMPWDADADGTDTGARWARLLQECSTSMFLARSGWEMLLAYVDGDPARPVGIGRGIHGTMPPSYPLPEFQSATTVRTRSSPASGGGSELAMGDSAGGQRIDIVAQRDLSTQVGHDQSIRVGGDSTEVVGATRQLLVHGDRSAAIGGDAKTVVNGNAREQIAGSLTQKVAGSESIEIVTDRVESVGANQSEKVGSVRLTIDGGIASPLEIVKSLVPDPRQAIAGALAAAKTAALAPVTNALNIARAPLSAAKGVGSSVGSAAQPGGLGGALEGAAASGSLPGISSVTDAVAALKGLPAALGSIPGSAGSALSGAVGAARQSLSGALKASIPSLTSVADALPLGSIKRQSNGRFSRRVGGAHLSASVGDVTTKALLAHAELVGAVRLKLTPRNIATSVGGPLVSLVGGTVLRSSQESIGLEARSAQFKVGGPFSVDATGSIVIKGDQVMLRSKTSLTVGSGAATLTLTPSKLTIAADLITDVAQVDVTGASLDVTKG